MDSPETRVKLTDRNVLTLPPLDGKRTDYTDETLEGFRLRVSPSGARSYSQLYTTKDGRRARFTIGNARLVNLAAARDKAREVSATVELGGDPQAEHVAERVARLTGTTFSELVDEFMRQAVLRPATRTAWEGIARKRIKPALGDKLPAEIERRDVREFVRRIAVEEQKPYMANRTFEVVRRVFSWAMEHDRVNVSPCAGIKKPGAETTRDRVLTADELRRVWGALEVDSDPLAVAVVKVVLLTGSRINEVLGMRWAELDFPQALWRLPAERYKTETAHGVPLSTLTLRLLSGLRDRAASETYVFAARRQGKAGGPQPLSRKPVVDCIARVSRVAGVEDWSAHDLRRTCRTGLQALGVPFHVAEAVLGHAPSKVVRAYSPDEPLTEMRDALQRWAEHVEQLVAEGERAPGEVVPMRRVARRS